MFFVVEVWLGFRVLADYIGRQRILNRLTRVRRTRKFGRQGPNQIMAQAKIFLVRSIFFISN
jgi:hypothetical protein